jgi:hypothetical protein
VVIDGGVEIVITDPASAWGAGAAAVGAVAATGRDAAQLLDVDMDQVARDGVFIAADDPPGGGPDPL